MKLNKIKLKRLEEGISQVRKTQIPTWFHDIKRFVVLYRLKTLNQIYIKSSSTCFCICVCISGFSM